MKIFRCLSVILSPLWIVVTTYSQVTQQKGWYQFRAKHTKGSVIRQLVSISLGTNGNKATTDSFVITSKVVDVKKNGTAVVDISTGASKAQIQLCRLTLSISQSREEFQVLREASAYQNKLLNWVKLGTEILKLVKESQ
ncbi:MAG: hypothetical protein NTU72_13380 [Fimbriimonadales bacterium]|nr:hypothetical protein [Fimbriimonadales bacterium]